MPLTDAQCRAAKPAAKVQKLSDSRGLFLQVTPGGSKLWRMNYRWQAKQRTAAFGSYPDVSLATARLKAAELKDKLAAGIDPAAKDGATAGAAPVKPFKDAARQWFNAREAQWVSGYAARIWSRLDADVFPQIGGKDVAAITPAEVLALLREVENRNALEMAKRLRQTMSAIFRFSVANGWASSDPAAPLAGAMKSAPRQQHRAALKEDQLPDFLKALQTYSGDRATALGLKIIAHTFVRTAELRLATWDELDGDTWRIPAGKMKMRKEHIVPLSPQVKAMFAELQDLVGGSQWVLPGQSGHKPVSENTLIYGLYRLGYHSRASVHGFRSTASTILNESGLWRADAIERQLAHVPANEVRSAYNAALYLEERRRMMCWYTAVKSAFLGAGGVSEDVRVYTPTDKPFIERHFGTLESVLLKILHAMFFDESVQAFSRTDGVQARTLRNGHLSDKTNGGTVPEDLRTSSGRPAAATFAWTARPFSQTKPAPCITMRKTYFSSCESAALALRSLAVARSSIG